MLKSEYANTPGIKKWNDLSKALLDKHKIDGLFDLDKAADAVKDAAKKAADAGKKPGRPANLTWAINWDHSKDYVESVYWFLKHADDKGGATGVTKALDDIAKVLARGEKFRCDPKCPGVRPRFSFSALQDPGDRLGWGHGETFAD